jgi:tRNA(Arg) A34 adenosine deaminase TadA
VLEEARRAIANGKIGVASLLLWHDEIIAIAHNLYIDTGDLTARAEMVVLRQVAERLNQMSAADKADLTLYTTLNLA